MQNDEIKFFEQKIYLRKENNLQKFNKKVPTNFKNNMIWTKI